MNETFSPAEPINGFDEFLASFTNNIAAYNFFGSSIHYNFKLSFYVDCDGGFSDITVLNDTAYGLSSQIIRIMEAMPKWKPAELNGISVRTYHELPIQFK